MSTEPVYIEQKSTRVIVNAALIGISEQVSRICCYWYTDISQDPFPVTVEEYRRFGADRSSQQGVILKFSVDDYLAAKKMCLDHYEVCGMKEFSDFEYLLGVMQGATNEINTNLLALLTQYEKGCHDGATLREHLIGEREMSEEIGRIKIRLLVLTGIDLSVGGLQQESSIKKHLMWASILVVAALTTMILWGYKGVFVIATCELIFSAFKKTLHEVWLGIMAQVAFLCFVVWAAKGLAIQIAGG
jgi:hypothetical protein